MAAILASGGRGRWNRSASQRLRGTAHRARSSTRPRRPRPPSATAARRGACRASRSSCGWRNAADLKAFDAAVSDPSSPSYAHYLSPAQFRDRFSPTAGDVAAVKGFLRQAGFNVGDELEGAHAGPRRPAPWRRPSVPSTPTCAPTASAATRLIEAAKPVSVPGLARRHAWRDRRSRTRPSRGRSLARRRRRPSSCRRSRARSSGHSASRPISRAAYGAASSRGRLRLRGAPDAGRVRRRSATSAPATTAPGETVAILDAFASPTIEEDIQTYSQKHGLPPANVKQTVFKPCPSHCSNENQQGWYGEETLDFDAVHTMAPGGDDPLLRRDRLRHRASTTRSRSSSTTTRRRSSPTPTASSARTSACRRSRRRMQIDQEAIAQGIGLYFSSGDGGDEKSTLGYITTDFPASSPLRDGRRRHEPRRRPDEQLPVRDGLGHIPRRRASKGKWRPTAGSLLLRRRRRHLAAVHRADLPGRRRPDHALGPLRRPRPRRARHLDGRRPDDGAAVGETQTFPNGKVKYAEAPLSAARACPRRCSPASWPSPTRHGGLRPRVRQPGALRARRHRRAPRRPTGADATGGGAPRLRQRRQRDEGHHAQPADARHGLVAADDGRATTTSPASGAPCGSALDHRDLRRRSPTCSQVRTIAFAKPMP